MIEARRCCEQVTTRNERHLRQRGLHRPDAGCPVVGDGDEQHLGTTQTDSLDPGRCLWPSCSVRVLTKVPGSARTTARSTVRRPTQSLMTPVCASKNCAAVASSTKRSSMPTPGRSLRGVRHLERVRGHGQLSRSAAEWGDRAEHLHRIARVAAGSPLPT